MRVRACGAGRSALRFGHRRSACPRTSARYSRPTSRAASWRHQPRVRLGCTRHDQQPAGLLVEPMHQSRRAARVPAPDRAPAARSGACARGCRRPGAPPAPAGLSSTSRPRSSCTMSSGSASAATPVSAANCASTTSCSPPWTRSRGARRPARERTAPEPDPALQPRARILRQRGGQCLIQAHVRPPPAAGQSTWIWNSGGIDRSGSAILARSTFILRVRT